MMDVSVEDVRDKLLTNDPPVLLDVRQFEEILQARLKHDLHIPLGELEGKIGDLEPYREKTIVCFCKTGGRSAKATEILERHGFKAFNMAGGIASWSKYVDSSVPLY